MNKVNRLVAVLFGLSLAACGGSGDGGGGDDDAAVSPGPDGGAGTPDAAVDTPDADLGTPDAAIPGEASLAFATQPSSVSSLAGMATDVVVQILDADGNLDTNATDEVTLAFANNAGDILLHNGGNGPFIVEAIDPATLDRLGWFEAQPGDEVRDILFNPTDGLVYYNVRSTGNFLSLDPISGVQTLIGAETVETRGLEFDGAGTLLSLGYDLPNISSYDPVTAVVTDLGELVPSEGTLTAFNGFSVDPTTGIFYAVARLDSPNVSTRALMTIDPVGLTATLVGDLGENMAGITFQADGTLWGLSGGAGGGTTTESLFTVDKATGLSTLVATVELNPNGNTDGEALGIMPARLFGTTTVAAVGGVATFSGLKIDASATGYTLEASVDPLAGLTPATSAAFDVTPLAGLDGVATLAAAAQTVAEDIGAVSIDASIDAAQTHDVTLTFEVAGTAGVGDSLLVDGNFFNVIILAGETTGSASFDIVDDMDVEGDETIDFTLINTALATPGAIVDHTVTITDNDAV